MSDKKSKLKNQMSKQKKGKKHIAELEQKIGEYMQGWQRAQADYQNLQKETDQWKKKFAQYAKEDFVIELLPVYTHYQMALAHIPKEDQDKDWVKGIQYIFDQLKSLLDKYNVMEIKTVGEEFDYNLHDAIGHEHQADKGEDIILKQIQPGYVLHNKVIQPAKVIVNRKNNDSEAEVEASTKEE